MNEQPGNRAVWLDALTMAEDFRDEKKDTFTFY
jgi:F0F1-type ATP synthase beta subunit